MLSNFYMLAPMMKDIINLFSSKPFETLLSLFYGLGNKDSEKL